MIRINEICALTKPLRLLLLFAVFSQDGKTVSGGSKEEKPRQSTQIAQTCSKATSNEQQVTTNNSSDFNQNIVSTIQALTKSSKFFTLALEAIDKKSYVFVLYSKENKEIPEKVHEVMAEDEYGALTFKDLKTVYINMERIKSGASKNDLSEEYCLLGVIANEAVHIILDPTQKGEEEGVFFDKPYNEEESKSEFSKMRSSNEYTESEITSHKVLNEEILSQVVDDIIVRQQKEPTYKMTRKNLLKDNYRPRLMQLGKSLSMSVLARMYDLSALNDEDTEVVLERVNKYLRSGEIERYLLTKLEEFDLLKI